MAMRVVVELEESDGRFTVSAVCENWIEIINDSTYCHWPENNAAKKIKLAVDPKSEGNWGLYKCRILMDGGNLLNFVLRNIFCLREHFFSKIWLLPSSERSRENLRKCVHHVGLQQEIETATRQRGSQ